MNLWLPFPLSGNAWHTHPTSTALPLNIATFTMGRTSDHSADIRYQWDHRYIPGESKWWDWGWALKKQVYSTCNTQQAEAYVPSTLTYRVIYAESQYAGTIEIGQAKPLNAGGSRSESSIDGENQITEQLGNIDVTTTLMLKN
ncbi:aerolysin family beta-barrel pore-forming toxin [Vibrio chagasii]|nr:aerolysin family beta-barrel pore-forming toxin [Vibrio chagasii]